MISSIEITRFRGIREGKLEDLTPLTVLVGPNGCGKSSVLDAMLIGASPAPADGVGRAVLRHRGVMEGARWLFWRADEKHSAAVFVSTSEKSYRKCELSLRTPYQVRKASVDCKVEALHYSGSTCTEFQGDQYQVHGAVKKLEAVPALRLIETRGNGLEVPLHQLFTETTKMGRREEAKEIVAAVVPEITDIAILTEANTPILYLVYKDGAVPVALSGDGVHALVRVTFELTSPPEGVVLFEEPEIHQHPGAIQQTVRAVLAAVRRGIQVILTTHSLELIDTVLAESGEDDLEKLSVYRMQLKDGVLRSYRLPGSEVAFTRNDIGNDLR